VGEIARELVEIDQGLRREDKIEPALQFLEAESALGEVLM
jgi:hypothetical protein